MRRKPKRGTKPALRMAARQSRIRPASGRMALISLIFVTPMATSSSGLPGKLPDLIALATAPHPGPLPASREREGPVQREGEGQGTASPDLSEGVRRCRALTDGVVDATPALDGCDVAVHRVEVRAHRHDRYVAPSSLAPRRNIAGPLIVPAAVLLDRLEAECVGIPAELAQLSDDPPPDLNRLGLSPARKQEAVPDPGRPVVSGLAEASKPDRDLPFRARQYSGSVDLVVGIFVVDHRLFPQFAEQGNLMLLPPAAAAKMPGHFEAVEFHPVPADPDAQAKPALREQVDIRSLFGEERSLPLRQDDHARYQFELLRDAGEVGVGHQRLVKRIAFFVRAGQLWFSAGMNGAEDMVVDHNMVVTQVLRRLGKRLDRPRSAAKFDQRINHTSFHRPLPPSRCEVLRQIQAISVQSESSSPNTGT